LARSGLLIKTKVNAAVDAGIVDIVGDLLKCRVRQSHSRSGGAGKSDVMPILAIKVLQDRTGAASGARMSGRVTWKRRRDDQGQPTGIGSRFSIVV
jgi:hypothetical protein